MSEWAHDRALPPAGKTLGGITGLHTQGSGTTTQLGALLEPLLGINGNAHALGGEMPKTDGGIEDLEAGLVIVGTEVAANRHPPPGILVMVKWE